jgi:predicted DNA-binding protein
MATVFKTSVNLPQEAVDALKEMADKKGTSQAEILRRAISTEKFLNDTMAQKGKILIQLPDGTMRELVKP